MSTKDKKRPINQGTNGKGHWLERTRRQLKLIYLKTIRINDPPESIARGAAIGVLMGILPTFGLGIVLSIICAIIIRANKTAAVLGSFIMNPITTPFFWTLSAGVGSLIFWEDRTKILSHIMDHQFLNGAGWAYLVFLAGNLIVSTVFSVGTYFIIKRAVERRRRERALRLTTQKNGREAA